jgi:hypothetical protein
MDWHPLSSASCCLWTAVVPGWLSFSDGFLLWMVVGLHPFAPFLKTKLWDGSASVGPFQRPIFRIRTDTGPSFDLRVVSRSGPRIDPLPFPWRGLRAFQRSGLRNDLNRVYRRKLGHFIPAPCRYEAVELPEPHALRVDRGRPEQDRCVEMQGVMCIPVGFG